jgi:hypothetical protein
MSKTDRCQRQTDDSDKHGIRARSVAPVSKPELLEIGRFRNWEREIGGGARVTLCHTTIYSLPRRFQLFFEHRAVSRG